MGQSDTPSRRILAHVAIAYALIFVGMTSCTPDHSVRQEDLIPLFDGGLATVTCVDGEFRVDYRDPVRESLSGPLEIRWFVQDIEGNGFCKLYGVGGGMLGLRSYEEFRLVDDRCVCHELQTGFQEGYFSLK